MISAQYVDGLELRIRELEKLSEAISRDCNNTANERNDLRDQLTAEREVSDKLWAALELVLPMAKGYAVANRVGSNDAYIKLAAAALTEVAAIRSKGEQA